MTNFIFLMTNFLYKKYFSSMIKGKIAPGGQNSKHAITNSNYLVL